MKHEDVLDRLNPGTRGATVELVDEYGRHHASVTETNVGVLVSLPPCPGRLTTRRYLAVDDCKSFDGWRVSVLRNGSPHNACVLRIGPARKAVLHAIKGALYA